MRPILFLSLLLIGCTTPPTDTRIAFGSCGHETDPQPILSLAASYKPDLFIFLGDNIYGDTDNMDTLRAKYQRLAAKPEYQQLDSATRILATWDDHDFGRNDAGKYYPFKEESKALFLEHFNEPANSARRQHPGSYPIYDITSSGITSTWDFPTPNKNRIEGPVMDNHFGLLTIRWEKVPVVKMEIIDWRNNVRVEYTN